jgi:hypothetical protein
MEAFAGIDVAFAKRKYLPISVCVRRNKNLTPLFLRSKLVPVPPRGHGNAKILDDETVMDFTESTFRYLRVVEKVFGVTIRRIAIDAPSEPKANGAARREAEKGLDKKRIRCITTPDTSQFNAKMRLGVGPNAINLSPSALMCKLRSSFQRKPESSLFKLFWTPAFATLTV